MADLRFRKDDMNKPRPTLLPMPELMAVIRVLEYGAAKYGVDNWMKCAEPRRYDDAALRHILDRITDPNTKDPDTGEDHYAHAICCLLFRMGIDRLKREQKLGVVDDGNKSGIETRSDAQSTDQSIGAGCYGSETAPTGR